jgi:D-3-phosphoglycerate dehydrogenase
LAETLGSLLSQIVGGRVDHLTVKLQGDLAVKQSQPIVVAALKGLLAQALHERVNYVNATIEAKERGIHIIEVRDEAVRDYSGGSLQLMARGTNGEHSVVGALLGDGEVRITQIDEFPVNVSPSRYLLFTRHRDMPGIIGKIGSLLGSFNVNIASMQVGRKIVRGDAVMALSLDDPLPDGILSEITQVPGISDAFTVVL